jgi:quercetin dioxygenase-like cupin family protein
MTTAAMMAPVKRAKTVSNSVAHGNGLVSVLIEGKDTGGVLSVMEIVARPGTEPPYHVHEREDECLYILEGHISVMIDGDVFEVTPGDTIFMPRQVPHTFRIRSEYMRAILTVTPSGFENFFRTIGRPVEALAIPKPVPPPAGFLEKIARASEQFGVRIEEDQPVF